MVQGTTTGLVAGNIEDTCTGHQTCIYRADSLSLYVSTSGSTVRIPVTRVKVDGIAGTLYRARVKALPLCMLSQDGCSTLYVGMKSHCQAEDYRAIQRLVHLCIGGESAQTASDGTVWQTAAHSQGPRAAPGPPNTFPNPRPAGERDRNSIDPGGGLRSAQLLDKG
jgi:hypothetical protein